MANKLRLQGIAWLAVIVLVVAGGLFFDANQAIFTANPFSQELELESPSVVNFDNQGNLYIADSSMMRILKINPAGEIEFTIYGGKTTAEEFYQCKFIVADEQGFVYVVDDVPCNNGMYITAERIMRFRPDGKFDRELAKFDYADLPIENRPMLNGWLRGVQIIDGKLYCLYAGNDDLLLCRIDTAGVTAIKTFDCIDARRYVLSGAIAADLQSIYYVTKRGEIVKNSGAERQICYEGYGDNHDLTEKSVPHDIGVDLQGNVFFSDRGSYSCIRKIATDGMVSIVVGKSIEYGSTKAGINANYDRMALSPDGRYLVTADQYSVVSSIDKVKTQFIKLDKVQLSSFMLLERLVMWLLLLIWAGGILYIVYRVVLSLLRRQWSQMVRYVVIALGVAISVGIAVAIIFSVYFYSILSKDMSGQITAIAHMAGRVIDGDAVSNIRYLRDCDSENMEKVRYQMAKLTNNFHQNKENLYYAVYQTNGRDVYQILAREDNVGTLGVMKHFYQGSVYQAIWESGKSQTFENVENTIGIWTYTIAPVYAADGKITALIEVGVNAERLLEEQKHLFFIIIGGVLSGVVVLMLCFTEGFYLIRLFRNHWQNNYEFEISESGVGDLLRPLGFTFTLPLYFTSAFLPIYSRALYKPMFGIPESIGIALPISAGALAMGLFSYLGSICQNKFGIKKVLIGSGLGAVCGFGICASTDEFWLFVLGKIIAGSGLGAAFVAITTLAADQADETKVQQGFADYYAAYFAAINVGCLIGGVTATLFGYHEVFVLSALSALVGVLLVVLFMDSKKTLKSSLKQISEVTVGIGLRKFLIDRQVVSFLILLYMPYIVSGYFMYYFFPILANQHGFTEGQIAQIFLLNGLSVVYLGPLLTPIIAKFLGNVGSACFGTLLCIGALIVFSVYPGINNAILVIIVMGLADSFVYTMQSSYYVGLNAVNQLGISKANGVQNIVQNIADTIAPIGFGAALLAGTVMGITIITTVVTAALTLFGLNNWKNRR